LRKKVDTKITSKYGKDYTYGGNKGKKLQFALATLTFRSSSSKLGSKRLKGEGEVL